MASDREDYGVKAPSLEIQFDGTDLYVVFNGVRIAKRGAKGTPQARTWVSLEPGYRVLVGGSRAPTAGLSSPTSSSSIMACRCSDLARQSLS